MSVGTKVVALRYSVRSLTRIIQFEHRKKLFMEALRLPCTPASKNYLLRFLKILGYQECYCLYCMFLSCHVRVFRVNPNSIVT